MCNSHPLRAAVAALVAAGMVLPGACVWRTEHKVETTSKIEAHIVLDIRQIKDEGAAVENYVRGDSTTPPPAPGEKPSSALAPREMKRWIEKSSLEGHAVAAVPVSNASPGFLTQASAPALMAVSVADRDAAIARRKARAAEVNAALTAKKVGENDHGYLAPLPEDAKENGELIKAENADRKIIYQDIAERKASNRLEAVEVLMAETIREKLKPGQMFQAPKEKEKFATFQQSELGKKYPEAKPGAWLAKK